ncbi:MAG: hypothetical protein ABSH56_25640 [Bryobacteraceae bacterium]
MVSARFTERGCVLVLHGIGDSGGSAAGFAPMFLTEGYAVLAPDAARTERAAANS